MVEWMRWGPQRTGGLARAALLEPRWVGLLAGVFSLGLASSIVVPFLSLWGTDAIGMTPLVFGTFMTITALSSMVLSTSLARWSDTRAPRRSVLLLAGTGGALGYVGYAWASAPLLLVIIGSVLLGGSSASFPQLFAHAREELAQPEYEGVDAPFALSVLRAAFALAWTVGPALGALLVRHFGYRGSFLAAAALFCVYSALIWGSVPRRAPVLDHLAAPRESFAKLLTRPALLANFAAFTLIFAGLSLNLMNLPLFLTKALGGNEAHVGTAFAIGPIAEMPLMIWFGRLAARGHQTAVIRFGILVGLVYFVLLSWARVPLHVYPLQLASAAAVAVTMSVAIPYFQDLVPGQTGVATSLYANCYSLGCLLGYFGFGALVSSVGHRGIVVLCAALAALSLTVLLLCQRRALPTPISSGLPGGQG